MFSLDTETVLIFLPLFNPFLQKPEQNQTNQSKAASPQNALSIPLWSSLQSQSLSLSVCTN